ncbi:sulfurtransferase [Salinicola avicenniae]|uniref:sulfurtransferase n=1 Tax=Salinicola avicenniae TaxID=2916836 RepID=UPI0020736AE5|nr:MULTISPECIES: sulfurtransferase [unclassified Salinicola]
MQSVLMTAAELQAQLASTAPPRVLDCRARLEDAAAGQTLWASGHVPGSLHMDMDRDLSAPPGEGGRHPLPSPEAFTATLRRFGIEPGQRVVVYDDRGGQLAAARAWWMLACWAGHPDVQVLDGGLPAWREAGGELGVETGSEVAASDWQPRYDDEAWVAADELLAGGGQLVDARGEARFRGDEEPIDPVAGHIPGAICRPSSANLTEEGGFKPADQLARELPGGASVTAYCGSGVSACHDILAYAVAGMPLPRLYVGSWSEWVRDPSRPVATGA